MRQRDRWGEYGDKAEKGKRRKLKFATPTFQTMINTLSKNGHDVVVLGDVQYLQLNI